jgi:hypothetical protein
MVTLGRPVAQSTVPFQAAASPDRRAMTITLDGTRSIARVDRLTLPIATVLFSAIVPVLDADGETEIEFGIPPVLTLTAGATATLLLSVNGQSTVYEASGPADVPSTVTVLPFVADRPSECRLVVVLLVGRDTAAPDSEGFAQLGPIDLEILPRAAAPTGPPV